MLLIIAALMTEFDKHVATLITAREDVATLYIDERLNGKARASCSPKQ